MKTSILFVVVVLFLSSCGKDHTITGRVYNPVTDEPIVGMKVNLLKDKWQTPGSQDGSGTKLVESTTTNANGEYSFNFKKKDSKQYRLAFFYDDKVYYDNIKPGNVAIEDNMTSYDLPLIPFGNLEEDIHNTNCFDDNDLISIKFTHKSIPTYYEDKFIKYFGCFSHDGNYNSVPMGWYKYEGTVTKNGVTVVKKDSIYVTAGGYHTWNLDY